MSGKPAASLCYNAQRAVFKGSAENFIGKFNTSVACSIA